MKTFIYVLLFVFSSNFLFAQTEVLTITSENEPTPKMVQNEFKFNTLSLLLEFPEVTYERILGDHASIGSSLAFSIGDRTFPYNFLLTPFVRAFFGEKKSSHFFIETSLPVFSQKYPGRTELNSEMGAGLGVAVGNKFISKNKWVGELILGLSRTYIGDDRKVNKFLPRFGVNIGTRF